MEPDEHILKWLDSHKASTKATYLSATKKFLEFTKLNGQQLLREIDEEASKPLTKRNGIKNRLKKFYYWLTGEDNKAEKGAATYVATMMGFYRFYNYPVNLQIGKELKPSPKNRKFNVSRENVRTLVNTAKNTRDRAIILTLFQSGMDLSTLCSLKVRDVERGIREGEVPLRLSLTRRKENVEYNTFLGVDAIEAVRAYLQERKRKEGELDLNSPLFVKYAQRPGAGFGKGKKLKKKVDKPVPMTRKLIEKFFRQIAVESKLVTPEEITANNWNPCRPHAVRRAFADQLSVAGVNQQVIDYLMGHKIPYDGAYFGEAYNAYKLNMDKLEVFGSRDEVVDLKVQALQTELAEVKEKLNEVYFRISLPVGCMDIRTATFLKEVLLMMKDDPTFMESTLDTLNELIVDADVRKPPNIY